MGSEVSEAIRKIIEDGKVLFKDDPTKIRTAVMDGEKAEARFRRQSERGWDRKGKKRDLRPPVGKKDPLPGKEPVFKAPKLKGIAFADISMADFDFADLNDLKGLEDVMEFKSIKNAFKEMSRDFTMQFSFDPGEYRRRGRQYSFDDIYFNGANPMPPVARTFLDEDWSSEKTYKTYTDLNDYMANRIATDTGQDVNKVARTLREARKRELEYVMIEDVRQGDPYYHTRPTLDGWEKLFSTFTYKPGFTFKFAPDPWTMGCAVWVQMMQEDINNHGNFVPVSVKMTLPEWTTEEEAKNYIRNKIILGLEQHEADEWMLFDGERHFDPHADRNSHLQIIDGKV